MSQPFGPASFAEALSEAGVDALWVTRPEHVRLLSGFRTPQDGRVLLTAGGATLYTDARYTVQAAQESRVPQFVAGPPRAQEDMLAHAADAVRGRRVGFESEHLSVAAHEALARAWQAELVPVRGLLESRRLVKTADELDAIRRAARVADEAFAEVRPTVTAGRREIDVALDLELAMRRRGASGPAFEIIVASGERGAMPHGVASEKEIREGELVTIDWGALVDGYHSDATRTFAVGAVPDELARLHRAVREAEEAGLRAVKAGARGADVDRAARDVLAGHGLAEFFTHSLGHGVGLAIHEGPRLSSISEDVLRSGMIVTVEPGVYVPGVGGVRIEDLVLVTDDGCEIITTAAKEEV